MLKAIIIIPIYKSEISEFEKVSLIQCCKILGKYEIALICPENLDVSNYLEILNFYKVSYKIEFFDLTFFENIDGYNSLMLNADFYKRFESYDFMLVYQLDAYVFQDELNYWCEKNYDYIGAPWFENWGLSDEKSKMLDFAGNGGFSLRKIKSFIDVLENEKAKDFIKESFKNGYSNEDNFFSRFAKNYSVDFKVASPEESTKFSFECQPERLYDIIGKKLPFGCHAWERYNFKFWEKFINLESVDFRRENTLNLEKLSFLRNIAEKSKFLENQLSQLNQELIEIKLILNKSSAELEKLQSSKEYKLALKLRKFFKRFLK